MKKKILIFGAGAIGRGFLAPLFFENGYEISFVDNNKILVGKLKKREFYTVTETGIKDYKYKKIRIR